MAYIVVCVNDVRDGIDGGRRYAVAPISRGMDVTERRAAQTAGRYES